MQQAKFNLKDFLGELSDGIADLQALSSLGQQFAENREYIINNLRAGAIQQVRARIQLMCTEQPGIAGVVNFLMTSDPDSAINAIGMYDAELAASLRTCQANFAELQKKTAPACGQCGTRALAFARYGLPDGWAILEGTTYCARCRTIV